MRYETPELFEMGDATELTKHGEVFPSLDRETGCRGWYPARVDDEPES